MSCHRRPRAAQAKGGENCSAAWPGGASVAWVSLGPAAEGSQRLPDYPRWHPATTPPPDGQLPGVQRVSGADLCFPCLPAVRPPLTC